MRLDGRSLLLIVGAEQAARELSRGLRLLGSLDVQTVHMATARSPDTVDAVVVGGIDLGSVDVLAKTKRLLQPFLLAGVPVVALLDRPSVREEGLARSLGASRILPAGGPLRELGVALDALVGALSAQRRTRRTAEIERAVPDVALSLADLLTSAAGGRDVSVGLAAEASTLLLRTVRSHDVDRWLDTMSAIDDLTYRHCMLMAGLTAAFAVSLGFKQADCDRLTQAAILHDIGKATIPLEILNKPGRLSPQELAIVQTHPETGYQMLKRQGDHSATTLDVVRSHHEYLDGSGYPLGLRDQQLSDEIRIATICDVFAALIEKRAYKAPLPSSDAYDMMLPMRGKLDPDLMRLFARLFIPADGRRDTDPDAGGLRA